MYENLIINNKVLVDYMGTTEDLREFIGALETSLEYARSKYIGRINSSPEEIQKIIDMMG